MSDFGLQFGTDHERRVLMIQEVGPDYVKAVRLEPVILPRDDVTILAAEDETNDWLDAIQDALPMDAVDRLANPIIAGIVRPLDAMEPEAL